MLAMTTTTITSDPGILCFHHCNVKVFCFNLPKICPNCKCELDTTNGCAAAVEDEQTVDVETEGVAETNSCRTSDSSKDNKALKRVIVSTKLLPFRLPYPFVRASQYPCAIVLRPTLGDFLNDYNNATDLHIAVTNSSGHVVEFDRNGLQRHRAEHMPEWWQCLLVGDVPEPWYDYWDNVLMQTCKQTECWTITKYHEETHNCYTFVLSFLQSLAYDKLSEAARSKTTFCEKYIVPRTTTAGKYISLYRKLRDVGIYVHPHLPKKSQKHQHQQQHRHGSRHKMNTSKSLAAALSATSSAANSSSFSSSSSSSASSSSSSIMSRSPRLCTIEE